MLGEFLINWKTEKEIAGYHARKDFRPTVVAAIRNEEQEFLVGEHPTSGSVFFIQGGIKPGEMLTAALRREVSEEVGIKRIQGIEFLFQQELPYLRNRKPRDGYTSGKVYFIASGEVRRSDLVDHKVDRIELANAQWADLDKLLLFCNTRMEPEKAGLIYAVLRELGYQVGGEKE